MLVGASAEIEIANGRTEDLFGYSGEELVGRRFYELLEERDRERAAAALAARRGVLEVRCVRKDGSGLQVQMSLGAVEPPAAGPGSAVVILRPGLALTQALVKLLSSAPDAIVVVRRDGNIVLTNDRVEGLFGYRVEELIGRPVEVLLPTRFAERHVHLREAYFSDPKVLLAHTRGGDLFGRRKDGFEFPVEIMLSPVNAETGMLVVASIRDATDRRTMELARLDAARAEEAVRLRDEFVSLAAHELRTPLQPLRFQVDRILRDATGERMAVDAQGARQLDEALRRMETMVEELVEVARYLAGDFTLKPEAVELGELVREEVERVRKRAEGAGAQFKLSTGPPLEGRWDRGAIRQVVAELLSNAIKFDGGAPIDVTVEREGDMAVLTVRDRGVGVRDENRDKLFQRFARFESSRNYAGLGIGLWLAKQVVERHGGRVGARGEGEGASFRVELPVG